MNDAALFVGRFHPLLVHFPIALLTLAALLHAVAAWSRSRRPEAPPPAAAAAAGLVLWLGAVSAVAAAIAGLLLGSSGGYGGETYTRHQYLGLAVAATSLIAALAGAVSSGPAGRRVQMWMLALVLALLVPVGHFGSALTHGEGFLAEHAPPLLRGLLGGTRASAPSLSGRPLDAIRTYESLAAPILQERCVTCHGPAKAEGGLRLDTPQGIAKGGDDGPAIVAGRAASSELVRRIWLPPSHEDAMPPGGHRPLAPAEASLLRWWIDQGARVDQTLADAEIGPEVAPVIEALVGPLNRGGPSLPARPVAPAGADALAAVRARGFTVEIIADGTSYLHVHATNAAARIDDQAVAALAGLAPQIAWLDLGATRISDRGLEAVARLPHLTRVELQRTEIGDAGLAHLGKLEHLEHLNLYGTRVTDAGLSHLSGLKRLRSLHVWQTAVTDAGVERLSDSLPRLTVTR